MAETANPLVSLMDIVADAVDWIHDTFSDPVLSRELRADLGLPADQDLDGDLPTGDGLRMRHPDGTPVDVDKAAFDATVAEVKAAYGLLVDFFGAFGFDLATLYDAIFLLGQIGASESIRARCPLAHNIARALGLTGAVVRGTLQPALTRSSEEVEAIDIFRSIDLMSGPSGVPSDRRDPDKRQLIRNWVAVATAVVGAIPEARPITARVAYGYDPELVPVAGSDELASSGGFSDALATGALTIDVFDRDPAGTPGFDGHLAVTITYSPSTDAVGPVPAVPTFVHLAVGGGASYTDGRLTLALEAPAGASVLKTFGGSWDAEPGTVVTASVTFGRRADSVEEGDRAFEWGERDGPHISVDALSLRGELSSKPSLRLELRTVDLSLALSDGDQFLRSISQELKSSFDLALVLDEDGFRFEGGPFAKEQGAPAPPATPRRDGLSAAPRVLRSGVSTTSGGVEAEVAPKRTTFGPFRIQTGRAAIGRGPDGAGSTSLELATSVNVDIWPFTLTIDRIGLRIDLRAGGVEPNLGLLDYDLRFQPPRGIGVTIHHTAIRGGGFLALDADRGEYAGVLELTFKGLTVKAIGILNTKAPEPAGWSFLLLIFAEFRDSPWQIGLGFNITAVGGLIGLQHRASVEELRAALGTNVYDDVLFPADPVRDAPRIIGRLRTVFPVAAHTIVVGPTVEINWGTPAVVAGRFAVLLQFGGAFGGASASFDRLTVIGTVRATAPQVTIDAPRLVELTADILGDWDLDGGLVAIDARLRDSKLGGVEFSGSLLVRIGTGANSAFAIAAGGFHPAFTDLPPAMPARIDRLGLRWEVGSHVTMTLQAYVAVTASSWQLGARLTIVAELGPVDIDGGVHFDVIAYDDGRFSAEIGGYVRIRWRGHTLMSVELELVIDRNELQVWHAVGTATFSVLWWDKTADFEETWGDEKSLPPLPAVDAAARVRAALEEPASWTVALPRGGDRLVTTAGAAATGVLAHPLGTLTVSQRIVPLGLRLDHLDGAPVIGAPVVQIGIARVGGSIAATAPIHAPFPRARFQHLSDEERLTEKTFVPLPAGTTISPTGTVNPAGTMVTLAFEPVTLAPHDAPPPPPPPPEPVVGDLRWHVSRARMSVSPLRQHVRLGATATDRLVDVVAPTVVVVDRDLAPAMELTDVEAASSALAGQRAGRGRFVVEAQELVG